MVRVPRVSILVVLDGATDAARYLVAGAFYALVVVSAGYTAIKGMQVLAGAGLSVLSAIVFDEDASAAPLAASPTPEHVRGAAPSRPGQQATRS